ncbi:hypothetical protein ACVBEF_06070 [Glaciimonas sp. GG7]
MPNSKASEQSTTTLQQRYFLIDFATLATDVSQGITTTLDIIETNELHRPTPHALTVSDAACQTLQKLALTSARLPGNHAIQEIESIDARSQPETPEEPAKK